MKSNESMNFYEQVYEVTRKIPVGKVTSYGLIAEYLGSKSSSRLIGTALSKCFSYKHPVPAHRVVNRNGMLTGKFHFGGNTTMENLLKSEGIEVKDNKIINFEKHLWSPFECVKK